MGDRLFGVVALTLAVACAAPYNDPERTGLAVSPLPGESYGPIDLRVANRTGSPLACTVVELDVCPPIGGVAELATLDVGETWSAPDVVCAGIDIACWAGEPDPAAPPLRAWGWSIVPDPEDDETDDGA